MCVGVGEAHHFGEEVVEESHLDLGVREIKGIGVAVKVVSFDSEVAALVEERQC